MKQKQFLYCDWDNVQNNWIDVYKEWVKVEYNITISDKTYQLDNELINEFNLKTGIENILYDNKMITFIDTNIIESLIEKYEFIIITSRPTTTVNYKYIYKWLIENNIFCSVIFSKRPKWEYLPDIDTIFVDDNPYELQYAIDEGFKNVIKLSKEYNKDIKCKSILTLKELL